MRVNCSQIAALLFLLLAGAEDSLAKNGSDLSTWTLFELCEEMDNEEVQLEIQRRDWFTAAELAQLFGLSVEQDLEDKSTAQGMRLNVVFCARGKPREWLHGFPTQTGIRDYFSFGKSDSIVVASQDAVLFTRSVNDRRPNLLYTMPGSRAVRRTELVQMSQDDGGELFFNRVPSGYEYFDTTEVNDRK